MRERIGFKARDFILAQLGFPHLWPFCREQSGETLSLFQMDEKSLRSFLVKLERAFLH
jgi:hypothetical protein